jgi:hypothetical protein
MEDLQVERHATRGKRSAVRGARYRTSRCRASDVLGAAGADAARTLSVDVERVAEGVVARVQTGRPVAASAELPAGTGNWKRPSAPVVDAPPV